jgi:hypothetical protein
MAKKANKPKGQPTGTALRYKEVRIRKSHLVKEYLDPSCHLTLIDHYMQDNGVNCVFLQNEGCIFNAENPRVTPGSAYYLPVNELS